MTGAASRRRGADAERAVVNYLRQWWPDARRVLAGDGRQDCDVTFHPRVSLEESAGQARFCGTMRAENKGAPGAIAVAPERGQHLYGGAVMTDRTCECGCGGIPTTGRFLKGHNAKLRGPKPAEHGEMRRYRQGCRCEDCRAANRAAKTAQARKRGVLPKDLANSAEVRASRPGTCTTPECTGWRTVDDHCRRCARRIARHGDPSVSWFALPPRERVAAAVDIQPDGCWRWTKALNHGGYGVTWDGARTVVAHRYSYEAHVGPIPDGLHLDHLCRNRACVNPDHLEPVTQAENNRRAKAANR